MSNTNGQTQRLANAADLQAHSNCQSSLFTSLSPEVASTVAGGGSFGQRVRFDYYLQTRKFNVRRGGTIALASRTWSALGNRKFLATIFNVGTRRTSSKIVDVGRDSTVWRGVRGGTYRIILRDSRDRTFVSGAIGVGYTS